MSEHEDKSDEDDDDSAGAVKAGKVSLPKDMRFVQAVDGLAAFPLEAWLWKLERKRSENRKRHDEEVRKKSPKSKKLDELGVLAAKQIAKWGVEADAFGEDEPELSAAWQAALDRIYSSDRYAGAILEALRSLSTVELMDFLECLEIMQAEGLSDRYLATLLSAKPPRLAGRLQELGLVRSTLHQSIGLMAVTVFAGIAASIFIFIYSLQFSSLVTTRASESLGLVGLATVMTATLIGYRLYTRRFGFTDAGNRFAETYRKYAPPPSSTKRFKRKPFPF